ncbi:MAG: DUF4391 domain-containing protein [Coriobacteriales bacterium]|nr:DUF4391 domain-containing protein [Coriobacteriales bacterium]
MFGLPSTTEVEQVLPKAGFYRNMDLDARIKKQFVSNVGRIVITNVIRPDTCNLADGFRAHEIFVIVVEPKGGGVSEAVVRTILRATPNRIVVVDGATGVVWAKGPSGTIRSDGLEEFRLNGRNLDEAWDSILAQVALREDDGVNVAERIKRSEAIEALEREVTTLERKCRRERQIARRNELFAKLRNKRRELDALRKGEAHG